MASWGGMRKPNQIATGRFMEDLHRNSSVNEKLNLPSRNDPRQRQWLAERRFEEDHVHALAEKHADLEWLHWNTRETLRHSEDYIMRLEAQLSDLKKINGASHSTHNNNRHDDRRAVPPTTPSGAKERDVFPRDEREVARHATFNDHPTSMGDNRGGQSHLSQEYRSQPSRESEAYSSQSEED